MLLGPKLLSVFVLFLRKIGKNDTVIMNPDSVEPNDPERKITFKNI